MCFVWQRKLLIFGFVCNDATKNVNIDNGLNADNISAPYWLYFILHSMHLYTCILYFLTFKIELTIYKQNTK